MAIVKRQLVVGLGALALIFTPAMPATAAEEEAQTSETTSVEIQDATVGGASVLVNGVVDYGADALGPVTLTEDQAGDATVSGAGYDIGDVTVETNLPGQRLYFTLDLNDGLPAPFNGPAAFSGYMFPLMVDGDDLSRWLGAGGIGSFFLTGGGGALCHHDTANGGWDCSDTVTTTMTADSVRWELRFNKMEPQIEHGSIIESSSIHCGRACSFHWTPNAVLAGIVSMDNSFPMDEFKVPGEVRLGIDAEGVPPNLVSFTDEAAFTPSTSAFSGTLPTPADPGSYTVWARTCYGSPITCTYGSLPLEIAG